MAFKVSNPGAPVSSSTSFQADPIKSIPPVATHAAPLQRLAAAIARLPGVNTRGANSSQLFLP